MVPRRPDIPPTTPAPQESESEMQPLVYAVPAAGILALLFAFWKTAWVNRQDAGTDEMKSIAELIRNGAMAFLAREYKVLAGFVVVVAALLAVANLGNQPGHSPLIALSFVVGACASGLAGYFGMRVATAANVRTTAAARLGLPQALAVAFSGGSVMGMSVVGLGLVGLGGLYLLYTQVLFTGADKLMTAINVITGFSMGASSIALFARVGGGIYTKAADVGADLVGKIESGHAGGRPAQPGGDRRQRRRQRGGRRRHGRGLVRVVRRRHRRRDGARRGRKQHRRWQLRTRRAAAGGRRGRHRVLDPGHVRGAHQEGGNPQVALDTGSFGAAGVMMVATFGLANVMWPAGGTDMGGQHVTWLDVGVATVIGLATGVAVGVITELLPLDRKGPVQQRRRQSLEDRARARTSSRPAPSACSPRRCRSCASPPASSATSRTSPACTASRIAAVGMLSTTAHRA